jgi:branched-chain amino acid transport system ATP-binding protein
MAERVLLRASNLTKRFGALVAVNNLSFQVKEGEIFGIAGPNGAGKSTVYNLLTGVYPFEGRVEFEGREIAGLPPHKIAHMGIARTFQVPQIFASLTVGECVDVGSRFGCPGGYDRAYTSEMLDFVSLTDQKDRPTEQLNLLGKKRLMIGASLATKPKILMLDEPMAGSNFKEIQQLMDLIKKINQDLGITIIIIEHFMKVLTELTKTLLIIETGTEICCGDPVEVTANPKVIQCYLGDAYAEN